MVADLETVRDRENRIRGYLRDLRELARRRSTAGKVGNREPPGLTRSTVLAII